MRKYANRIIPPPPPGVIWFRTISKECLPRASQRILHTLRQWLCVPPTGYSIPARPSRPTRFSPVECSPVQSFPIQSLCGTPPQRGIPKPPSKWEWPRRGAASILATTVSVSCFPVLSLGSKQGTSQGREKMQEQDDESSQVGPPWQAHQLPPMTWFHQGGPAQQAETPRVQDGSTRADPPSDLPPACGAGGAQQDVLGIGANNNFLPGRYSL